MTEAEQFLGQIDVYMINAAITHSGNPEDFPATEWEIMFSVNLLGTRMWMVGKQLRGVPLRLMILSRQKWTSSGAVIQAYGADGPFH